MKEVNLINSTRRIFSLLLYVAIIGCKESDPEPEEPEEPTITELKGVAPTIGISLFYKSFYGAGFRVIDAVSGKEYSISLNKAEAGFGDNATLSFSEFDVVTDESEIFVLQEGWTVAVRKIAPVVGTLTFYEGDDGKKSMGIKTIEFYTDGETIIGISPDDDDEFERLSEDRDYFKSVSRDALKEFSDSKPDIPGDQPIPLVANVWVIK